MSSFKRKTSAKPRASLPTGTRTSPSSSATIITSTGIPSLDDILGGGLPLSCSLLVLAPDEHSAYGELVQKYFIAQGIASQQKVCVVGGDVEDFVSECMWMPASSFLSSAPPIPDEEDDVKDVSDTKVKIAWRYEQMKQFQTTVSSSYQSTDDFCRTFDLTCRIPEAVIDEATKSSRLAFIDITDDATSELVVARTIREIAELLRVASLSSASPPLRICVPSLGSPYWGDLQPTEILRFLYLLRSLLRHHPNACAAIGFPPNVSTDGWGGLGWIGKLGFLSDAAVTLAGFTADPSISSLFPAHHGLLQIHTLPSPHTLLSPSDRFSTLRGITSSSGSMGGGENNLAFKCMRKRLVFETLHLDVEGGVGERRTTRAAHSIASEEGASEGKPILPIQTKQKTLAAATVEVQLEPTGQPSAVELEATVAPKPTKAKKKVAFRSDRPDLYDF